MKPAGFGCAFLKRSSGFVISGNCVIKRLIGSGKALEAALKCRFKPGENNGEPVATWVTYQVKFRLADKGDKQDSD